MEAYESISTYIGVQQTPLNGRPIPKYTLGAEMRPDIATYAICVYVTQ
jgi:hypothetical protein